MPQHSSTAMTHAGILPINSNERLIWHRSADNHRTFVIHSDNAAAILIYVDAKYRNRHDLAPLPTMKRHHTRCSPKGATSHEQHPDYHRRDNGPLRAESMSTSGYRIILLIFEAGNRLALGPSFVDIIIPMNRRNVHFPCR